MAGIGASASIGIYLDGGSSNQLVYSNVGWGNNHGVVALVNGNATNDRIDGNDGGVYVYRVPSASGTMLRNNIGGMWIDDGKDSRYPAGSPPSDPNIRLTAAANMAPNAPGYPGYANEAAKDFRPAASSPARSTGLVIPGETDGYVDNGPSKGAYQYGAPYWQPGASSVLATVIRPDYGASSAAASPAGSWFQADGAVGSNDSHPDYYAVLAPWGAAADGTVRLAYQSPSGAGWAIDHVEVRVFARMHRQSQTDGNFVLSVNGVSAFDAQHKDFDATGRPITIDVTKNVGGSWANLPRSVDIHGTLADAPFTCYCFQTTGIWVHAVEVYIQAHRI
jgi:hypothetical protein